MAYAMWRHKFLDHHILVHDDETALKAERAAMHTGRAEAWRHGKLTDDRFTEYDMRMAYCRITSQHDLPTKLKFHDGKLPLAHYRKFREKYRILARVQVVTDVPVLPARIDGHEMWPVGEFETVVWDCEIDDALEAGATIQILEAWRYTKAPIMRRWADWSLAAMRPGAERFSPLIRMWIKDQPRALLGRRAFSSRVWEGFGVNPHDLIRVS